MKKLKKIAKKDLTIDAVKMVREIRDKHYKEYLKNPKAYYERLKKSKPI